MVAVIRGRTGWAAAAVLIGLTGVPAVSHGVTRTDVRPLAGRVGVLDAVHIVAPGNVWAGGYHNPLTSPLLFHKGRSWRARTVPGVPDGAVNAIGATSRTDVWAAGDRIYHWDGARWWTVPAPHPGTEATYYGVAALSPSNAWAVGGYLDDNAEIERTLIAHWNGRSWHRVPSPSLGFTDLRSVSFVSGKDGWAAGGRLVLHWDGSRWTRVAIPRRMGTTRSLVAVSKRDVWAAGASIWHWNGTAWHQATFPLRNSSSLNAIDAYAGNGVWALGRACDPQRGCRILALRWDGTRWTRTPMPSPAPGVIMTSVSAFGAGDVWAVGYHGGTGEEQTVAMHWTGHRWSIG